MSKITRRDFLKVSALTAGGAAFASAAAALGGIRQNGNRPNVLILLFDTTTAPHLSLYGYPRRTTPNLERFAERSTVYHSHYSGGSFTISGTASILTGLYPWNHRAVNPGGPVRRDLAGNNLFRAVGADYQRIGYGQNLWAEMFLRQFHDDLDLHLPTTSFAYPNPMLLGETTQKDLIPYIAYDDFLVGGVKLDTPYPGSVTLGMLDVALGRGRSVNAELKATDPRSVPFNGYYYYRNHTLFQGILDSVRAAANGARPYFGYFHLWAPHGPYAPEKEFLGLFDDGLKVTAKPRHPLVPKKEAVSDQALTKIARVYDQYIANVDAEFGFLMDEMEQSGLLDNTCVVVLSDHGQLFERGVHGHQSRLLYDQGIHVPLMISLPGQATRQDIYEPTSNVDLLPTLVNLTGGENPAQLDGRLLPGLGGDAAFERSVFCVDAKESSAYRPLDVATFTIIQGNYKLLLHTGYAGFEDIVELYDLQSDPEEMNDLSKAEAVITKQLLDELLAAREEADRPFRALGRR